MTQKDLLLLVNKLLRQGKVPYMLTGAYAVIYYGRPRTSHDLDFIVDIEAKDIPKLEKLLTQFNDGLMWQTSAIEDAVKNKSMFNVVYLPSMDKIDFWLITKSKFDQSRFKRRKEFDVMGQPMALASAEDTILQKLRWYDKSKIEKHLIDAAFVYQLQENLDQKYIDKWAAELDVSKYLSQIAKVDLEEHY